MKSMQRLRPTPTGSQREGEERRVVRAVRRVSEEIVVREESEGGVKWVWRVVVAARISSESLGLQRRCKDVRAAAGEEKSIILVWGGDMYASANSCCCLLLIWSVQMGSQERIVGWINVADECNV